MFLLKLILVTQVIRSIQSLQPNEYCFSNDILCFKNNNVECSKLCNSPNKTYRCQNDVCTRNRAKCNDYLRNNKNSNIIRICPLMPFRTSINDVCRKNSINDCKGKYAFKCNDTICTTNNKACDALKSRIIDLNNQSTISNCN